MSAEKFRDRRHAGRMLAQALAHYAGRGDALVLALPRGGVPVAFEVAEALQVPLDVFAVRKLGMPGHEEYAMGAIAGGGVRVLNPEAVEWLGIDAATIDAIAAAEQRELERRERLYRGERPAPNVQGRTVIVIDDGLATGSTMRAAVQALRVQAPARVVVAVPIAAAETCAQLRREADELVCISTPEPFSAVGCWYEDFTQTSDEQVHALLARAQQPAALAFNSPRSAPMKSPGHLQWPDHKVKETHLSRRMKIAVDGEVIADSINVICVEEDGHPPRYYFPRSDLRMDKLQRSATKAQCPFKGTGHYYDLMNGDTPMADAAWSYEEPYDEHRNLKDRLVLDDLKYPSVHIHPRL